ncbi:MAG: 16S rRNA (uracil(1498)-N(3))-methyltransferase [Campylobacterota bacterium]
MQFTYDVNAKNDILEINNDNFKYLIKARRHKVGDEIYFRNLQDEYIYLYKLDSVARKSATLTLLEKVKKVVENQKKLHLGWCVIDPKLIEKNIASLNEIGVNKITFIYCKYSQTNFKINMEKLKRILYNSSSQCGRSSIIQLKTCDSLDRFIEENNDIYLVDFSKKLISDCKEDINTILVGCEGGFSSDERENFQSDKIVGFKSNLILRSETAVISAASKILV